MRKLDHCNIVRLRYFFYSSGDKVSAAALNLSALTTLLQLELNAADQEEDCMFHIK